MKNMSSAGVSNDIETMNNNERQFIFTNEDDEMEILSNDEINDYVNKKIDLIKEIRNNNGKQTVDSVSIEELINTKLETLKQEFTNCFNDFKNEFCEKMISREDQEDGEDEDQEDEAC